MEPRVQALRKRAAEAWNRIRGRILSADEMWMPGRYLNFIKGVAWRFGHSNSTVMAAAVAFYGIVCLTPLGTLAVVALQHVAGTRAAAREELLEFVKSLAPADTIVLLRQLENVLAIPNPGLTGGLSFLGLVWFGMRLFETLERAFWVVWPSYRQRSYLGRKLVGFVTLVGAGGALAGHMVLVSAIANLQAWLQSTGAPVEKLLPFHVSSRLVTGVITFISYVLIYKVLPPKRISTRDAALAALFAAVALVLVQPAFTHFIGRSARDGSIYGGMTSVVLFALWMYVTASVTLLGAHIVAQLENAPMPVPLNNRTDVTDGSGHQQ